MGIYEEAAQELLRAIRGPRSQIAFARKLGYRANPITDWETGRRSPTILETLRAAHLAKIGVREVLERFAPIAPPTPEWSASESNGLGCEREDRRLSDWLSDLRGSRSISDLAHHAECSRYSIGRWLNGQSEPRLPDFLRLLDVLTGRVHDFIHLLVGIEHVPVLFGRYAQIQAARRLALDRPWSEAVLRVLETRDYQKAKTHDDGYIARRLGVEVSEVASLLMELRAARIVEKSGRRYRVIDNLTVDTSSTHEELRTVREHWARICLGRLAARHEGDWFAYNVIAVSQADSERVEQRLRAAYREVRGIVAESTNPDVAAVLTMQLVRW